MRTQRKIFHLLADNGINGSPFRYLPEVSLRHKFDFTKPFTITDKIDGTTVQADNQSSYQRRDKFKKGDPKKFSASEEERYFLQELDTSNPENKWILQAIQPFQNNMREMPHGLVAYFECFGSKIQDRYRTFAGHSIRIFDFAFNDKYLPFEETIQKCTSLNLPIVGHAVRRFSDLSQLLMTFTMSEHIAPELKSFVLEGWVIRQEDEIAKIRKDDLHKMFVPVSLYGDKTHEA